MRRREGTTTTRLAAFGGHKGGAGRSTLTVEMAKTLARRDQRVVIVDLHPRSGALPTLLECDAPKAHATRDVVGNVGPLSLAKTTNQANIRLLSLLPASPRDTPSHRHARALARWLRRSGADWVLIDQPASLLRIHLALFTAADMPLLVTTPEPTSLTASSEFLRACLLFALHHHPEVGEAMREHLTPHTLPDDEWGFDALHERLPPSLQGRLRETCEQLIIGLIINQTREGSEVDQAQALAHAWGARLGIWPQTVGAIRHDERRWFFARKLAPPVSHARDDSLLGDIDQIARAWISHDWIEWAQPRPCLPMIDPKRDARVFLDLPDGTQQTEARQRYRRMWEGYRRDTGMVAFILDDASRKDILTLLDGAYRSAKNTLFDTNPSMETFSIANPRRHPGQLLRLARMRSGLGLRELSLRTRVSVKHIEAIETGNQRALPDRVYLKAYLSEIARTLGLEPEAIVHDYVQRLDQRR